MTSQSSTSPGGIWADEDDDIELKRHRKLLSVVDDGIYQLDSAGTFVAVDDNLLSITGHTREELLGEHISVLFSESDVEHFEREIPEPDGEEDVATFQVFARRPDGRRVPCEVRIAPLLEDRTRIGTLGTVKKRPSQTVSSKSVEATQEQFHSLMDAVEEYAIFRLDTAGQVISWNSGAEQIKGYDAGEILGEHFSTFYTESDRADGVPAQNLEHARKRGSTRDEGWRVRKDGSRFWATVTITTLYDSAGTLEGYLKVTRDMTDRHEREQELESELHRILSRISDAFYALDDEWRFTHVNERAAELLQHPRESLLGKRLWEIFPEAEDTVVWDHFQTAMETQEPVNFELEYEALDIWVEATAYPSESGLSVYFRDITERYERHREIERRDRQLRNYKEYTDEILDTIDDLFYVVDEDGNYQRWNDSMNTVTGYSDEEIASTSPLGIVADEDMENVADGIQTVFETGGARIQADIESKAGNVIPMEFTASALETPDGERVLAGIGRDISDRIEYERALEASNERLEQFAHAASHDLQEPLRMVSSYLRLLEQRYGDNLDQDGREFLEYAVDGADRMHDMIEGLLEYSRVETRGQPFEPVPLDDILADARDNLRVAITEQNAEITSQSLPTVDGDRRQLRQLFQNLLDNAIKYSGDEPPKIHVAAELCESCPETQSVRGYDVTTADRDRWVVSIEDQGIGIEGDDQEKIFEVFQSLDRQDEHGSGIGLALCKRIVERHHGEIWADSDPGAGTTISVTLPATGETNE